MFESLGSIAKSLEIVKTRNIKLLESPIEAKLYFEFKWWGLSPDTQVIVGPYRADICFKEEKIIIECDGKEFHKDAERDERRDKYLMERGYTVVRYTGTEIHRDVRQIVYDFIMAYLPQHFAIEAFKNNESFILEDIERQNDYYINHEKSEDYEAQDL